jgi:hypothetical protein
MRWATWLMLVGVVLCGCTQVDENPNWNPQADLPDWTYDAPIYYRPSEDLPVAETVGEGIPVYHTRQEYFFIRHPAGYQVNGEPRMAVWFSADGGKSWSKAGYFGVEQTHFLFRAKEDGAYWIRFVGPGQGSSDMPAEAPQRIYVADRSPPAVVVSVSPPPWEDQQKTIPHIYRVGQTVNVSWGVSDRNLAAGTIKLTTFFVRFPQNLIWGRFPEALPDAGSEPIQIPPEAARDGGMKFRVEAADKAGNVAVAFSEALQVTAGPVTESQPAVRPAGQFEPVAHPSMEDKPGWPQPGAFLWGGSSQVLGWIPKEAGEHENVELQLSCDDGQSWQTAASGLKPGKSVNWTVPSVSSRNCRLRIAAILPGIGDKERPAAMTIVMSQRFTVDTVPAGPVPGKKQ